MGIEVAVASLAITAGSAYMQYQAAQDQKDALEDQARASRAQFEAQQRRADIENARSMRQAVRQARAARSVVVNAGANSGTLTSSGVQGGVASIGSQLNSNLSYIGDIAETNAEIAAASLASNQAQIAQGQASAEGAQWGAIGSLSSTIFQASGGFRTIGKSVS